MRNILLESQREQESDSLRVYAFLWKNEDDIEELLVLFGATINIIEDGIHITGFMDMSEPDAYHPRSDSTYRYIEAVFEPATQSNS